MTTELRPSLMDVQGRTVSVLADGVREAGPHTASLDAGELSSGLYFLRMAAGPRHRARRLTVIR